MGSTTTLHFDHHQKVYRSPDAHLVVAREQDTVTPNGNRMNGRWALRDSAGNLLDFDHYRHDLAERNELKLIGFE